jgi:hypothetical protein
MIIRAQLQFSLYANRNALCKKRTVVQCCRHDIFKYEVGSERKQDILKQVNMHGGLNNLLKRNGHCPLETCKQAIEKTFALGLIGLQTYKECIEINKKSNKAKHHW